jgi:mycothiol synthase
LDPLPAPAAFPNGVRIERWTRERDAAIREAYNAAFADRGFAGDGIAEWAAGPFSGQESFRPELSFLALEGGTISGFVLCTVEDDEPHTGWIDTVGVRPAARGRGIADALLLAAMRAMHAAGLQDAALRVNDDNPRARRVYDRLGFATRRKHVVYRKPV